MKTLLSFKNDTQIKENWIATMQAHAKADELIQGQYWEDGKGCFIGCSVKDSNPMLLEQQYGWPVMYTKLVERIFEGLPNEEAKVFAVEIIEKTPVGIELKGICWKFLLEMLKDVLQYSDEKTRPAIERVISLYERKIAGEIVSDSEFKDAALAAAAADDAAAAVEAAAYAAALAAAAADAAALATAYAASAVYAAYADKYKFFRDMLYRLLEKGE